MQNQQIASYTTTLLQLVPKVLTVSGNEKGTPPSNHFVLSVSTNCTKCFDWKKVDTTFFGFNLSQKVVYFKLPNKYDQISKVKLHSEQIYII